MASGEHSHTSEASAPTQSRIMGISLSQKQALMDNLQLEITERARKLRAQYALQAQGLRTRMEVRVNRIPHALRKRKMQDLLDECAEKEKPAPSAPLPVMAKSGANIASATSEANKQKSLKRMSDQISTEDHNAYNDKENMPMENSSHQHLPNPKKRSKVVSTANTKATRTASRSKPGPAPANVLSPKSHNSRTLQRSPFKAPASPEKPQPPTSRYAIPTKTNTLSTALHPTSKPTSRAPSRQTHKRGANAPERDAETETEGRSSEASTASSAGTTIITKPAAKRAPAAARKPAVPKTTAAGKKAVATAAVKKENVPPVAAAGGRTLRKRG